MVCLNLPGMTSTFILFVTLICNIKYAFSRAPSVCNPPEGYTLISVDEILQGHYKKGVSTEKNRGEYDIYIIDRTLQKYHKVALCLHGYMRLLEDHAVQMIVHKKVGDEHYVGYVDKYIPNFKDVSPSCSAVQAFKFTGEVSNIAPYSLRQYGSSIFRSDNEVKILSAMNALACGGFVDPVNGHYPPGAVVQPHSDHVEAINLSAVPSSFMTISCGKELQNFNKAEQDRLYNFEMGDAKYSALASVQGDKVDVLSFCKYGKGMEPRIIYDDDAEFKTALFNLVPSDIVLGSKAPLPHGAKYHKLNDMVEEVNIDRFINRLLYCKVGKMALAIGENDTDTLWRIRAPKDDDKLAYSILVGNKGDLKVYDELKVVDAYKVLRDGTVEKVFKGLFSSDIDQLAQPLMTYYREHYPNPDEDEGLFSAVKKFFKPEVDVNYKRKALSVIPASL